MFYVKYKKMRNMKSLHIFRIIVIKNRREIPRVALGK